MNSAQGDAERFNAEARVDALERANDAQRQEITSLRLFAEQALAVVEEQALASRRVQQSLEGLREAATLLLANVPASEGARVASRGAAPGTVPVVTYEQPRRSPVARPARIREAIDAALTPRTPGAA